VQEEHGCTALLLAMAVVAGLAWAAALALIFFGDIHRVREPLAIQRIIFCIIALVAGVLTFIPIQQRLRIPGLALSGSVGAFLTLYCLAFVPAPTDWLLSPPDAPVYLIFAAAMYWLVSSAALPIIFAIGQRFFHDRARQFDLRRARRQSRLAGAAIVLCILLAGLRIFTLLGVVLVVLIVIVSEFLFLAFVKAEG
jgi:hypothetical protein